MAQHGYLGDGYGAHGEYDPDYDDRDRDSDRDRERGWRERRQERGAMFGDREGNRSDAGERFAGRERGGAFARGGDPARSWFRDMPDGEPGRLGSQADYHTQSRRERSSAWEDNGDWPRRENQRDFRSHQDDHYRSWRDQQMQALDRDYADYCREREQQFHSDFEAWRSQRRGNPEPLRPGMTQTGQSEDPSGATQAHDDAEPPHRGPDPLATATLGTNSTERSTTGRGRR